VHRHRDVLGDPATPLLHLREFHDAGGDPSVLHADTVADALSGAESGDDCEARQAQGVGVGNARLLIWAPWSSWTGDVKSANRQNTIAQMRALWPNYVYDIEEDFYQLGAPGAPYDDPTNYAAGRPPAALKEANGTLHPNDTGYGELRKLIGAWIVARKWDL
jgi:hypothetical protein